MVTFIFKSGLKKEKEKTKKKERGTALHRVTFDFPSIFFLFIILLFSILLGIDMGAPEAGSLNKTVDATLEYLSAGPLDNSDMSTAVPTSGKKKRKKRSLDFHNQIDCTGPSVLENVRQDISKGSHEGNYGDLDTEAAALRLKKNHLDSVQEEEELETAVTHSEPGDFYVLFYQCVVQDNFAWSSIIAVF